MASLPYTITFVAKKKDSDLYHEILKSENKQICTKTGTPYDHKYIVQGKEYTLPPMAFENINKDIINVFMTVLKHKYQNLSIAVYPPEHFDILANENIGTPEIKADQSIPLFYKLFKGNDYNLLTKDVLVFPMLYGYSWHLVVVDKPRNAITEKRNCDVYFISPHPVVPSMAISKLVVKYMEMAFKALDKKFLPSNVSYVEMIVPDYPDQSHTICCVFMELAHIIVNQKRTMLELFQGIKQDTFRVKMDNQIYCRYIQTIFNCFLVDNNKFGQCPEIEVLAVEELDLLWVVGNHTKRLLDHDYQMRNARPVRYFGEELPKREPMSVFIKKWNEEQKLKEEKEKKEKEEKEKKEKEEKEKDGKDGQSEKPQDEPSTSDK